jgi:hypothetical protein
MRLFEAWRHYVFSGREKKATQDERRAFQAGARHVLSELLDHLDGSEDAATTAMRLNDEIHQFATVALLQT